ncbi:MAG: hypothetical protein JO254_01065 [Pseudolabrys sp.]|nr:hypothetical protein [Pseudolabrys sp.]
MPDWIKASKAVRLSTMAAVACAVVVGALLFWNAWTFAYVFWIGTSPVPFADQWDAPPFPDQIVRNLFRLHNEHRPALARLVLLLDWYLADARNVVNAAFIAACYPVFGLTLFKLVNTIVADWRRAGLFAGLASAIILSVAQWENMLWGFQTHFVGSFVFVLLALYFAARAAPASGSPGRKTANVCLCLFASFAAVFSLASGLLVLPFVAALFFLLGASPRLKYGYILFALAAIAFYFHGFAIPKDHANPLTSLRDPWAVGHFALAYVGSPFARGHTEVAAPVGALGLLVLIALIAHAAVALAQEPRLLQAPKGAAYIVLLLFAVFIFCVGGLTALGRINFGIPEALAPRYATPALFFWATLVAACLVQSDVRRGGGSRILRWGGALLGVALATCVALQQRAYVADMYNKKADRFDAAIAYLLGIRNKPTALQLYPVPPVLAAGHLDEPFQRLRRSRKSIFAAEDWAARLGTSLREWKSDLSAACRGAIDRRAPVPDQATATSEIAGWAWDDERKRVPDLIVFTDTEGLVIGFAGLGIRRLDVRERQAGVTSSAAGWEGFVRADGTATIHAYGVTLGRSNQSCEFATSVSSQ